MKNQDFLNTVARFRLMSCCGIVAIAICAPAVFSAAAAQDAIPSITGVPREPTPPQLQMNGMPQQPALQEPPPVLSPETERDIRDVTQQQATEPMQAPAQEGLSAPDAAPSAVVQERVVEEDVDRYFDAESIVPNSELDDVTGLREVDPRFEPAQRFIIVEDVRAASDTESLLVSANRAMKLGRYGSALEIYERLYKRNRRDPRILMGLAVAQHKSGFTDSAIRTYESVLKINPKNTEALVNMLGLVSGQYPEVALRRLMDLWDRYPRHAGIAAQIGVTSAELENYEDAFRYLGIAASMEPNNASHLYNMAIAADRSGRKDKAIDLYEKTLQADALYGASRSVPRATIYDRLARLRRL